MSELKTRAEIIGEWPELYHEALLNMLRQRDEAVIEACAKEICLGCANGEPIVDRYLEKYWHMETGTCRAKSICALKEQLK